MVSMEHLAITFDGLLHVGQAICRCLVLDGERFLRLRERKPIMGKHVVVMCKNEAPLNKVLMVREYSVPG